MKFATRLTDPKLGTFRFRIGDYRVIFDIDGEDIGIHMAKSKKSPEVVYYLVEKNTEMLYKKQSIL
jgi:mRNA-degrading endonuclease RelE of RelBE toxin-antitoxin system